MRVARLVALAAVMTLLAGCGWPLLGQPTIHTGPVGLYHPHKASGSMVEFGTRGKYGTTCEIDVAPYLPTTHVYCFSGRHAANGAFDERTTVCTTLSESGTVELGHEGQQSWCAVGNSYPGAPVLRPGQSMPFGPFRCTAQGAGVYCVVQKTGVGFRLSELHVQRVGHL